jgi:hypothetical protein
VRGEGINRISVVQARCAPCIRAYSNLNSFVAETLNQLAFGADIPGPDPKETFETLDQAVRAMKPCVDDEAYQKTVDFLEKVGEKGSVNRMLDAIAPMIEQGVAEEVSVRCCG